MTDQFCGNCGIRTEGNTTSSLQQDDYNITNCSICGQIIQFTLLAKPIKNYDVSQAIFESTPLTDKKAKQAAKRKAIEAKQNARK